MSSFCGVPGAAQQLTSSQLEIWNVNTLKMDGMISSSTHRRQPARVLPHVLSTLYMSNISNTLQTFYFALNVYIFFQRTILKCHTLIRTISYILLRRSGECSTRRTRTRTGSWPPRSGDRSSTAQECPHQCEYMYQISSLHHLIKEISCTAATAD